MARRSAFSAQHVALVLFVAVLGSVAALVQASDGSSVSYGSALSITAHGTCKTVTNWSGTGATVYVPTYTSAEWASFYNNPPSGISISGCTQTIDVNWWLATYGFGWMGSPGCMLHASGYHEANLVGICQHQGYSTYVSYTPQAKWTNSMCIPQADAANPVRWGDGSCSSCGGPFVATITCSN